MYLPFLKHQIQIGVKNFGQWPKSNEEMISGLPVMGRGLAGCVCPLFFPAITDSVYLFLHNLPTDSSWRRSFESEGLPVPMPSHWDMGLTTQPLPNCPRGHQCLLSVLVNTGVIIQTPPVLAMGFEPLLFSLSMKFFLKVIDGCISGVTDCFALVPSSSGNSGLSTLPFLPYGLWG